MYASPVWLGNNLGTFKKFMSKVLLKITGAQFYPPKALSEILTFLPSLELSLEVNIVKFLLKCLRDDGNMKGMILQLEETPAHPYYNHVTLVKKYLQCKWSHTESNPTVTNIRDISLIDVPDSSLTYSKEDILAYQFHQWDQSIKTDYMSAFLSECEQDVATNYGSDEIAVDTSMAYKMPLLSRSDSRVNNTDLLDFIHGRSKRFQNFRKTVSNSITSAICLDCKSEEDSPQHKLFYCPIFNGSQRDAFISEIDLEYATDYKLKLLFSKEQSIRVSFRHLVKYICEKSEHDDLYYQSE